MQQRFVVHTDHKKIDTEIRSVINNFELYTDILGDAERNVIKIVTLGGKKSAIKSFKIPNVINQIAYRFFRSSKAQRSYDYANTLLDLGIGTPYPIAYCTESSLLFFKKSYYISELVTCDLTYRELTTDFSIPDYDNMLRAFTRFTYALHEKGVHFLDHSPGNTLIKRKGINEYEFYLVDLNRMKFGNMNFDTRMRNFARLTIYESMVAVMSNEYAKCSGEDEKKIYDLMWKYTKEFQGKYYKKIRLKRKIFFWKKKYRTISSDSPI